MPPCSSPPGVSNGFFVIAKGTYGDGDQISYYCKMGYELTGAVTRSCDGATGSWSGTTPKCTAATTTTSATTTTESTTQITGRYKSIVFLGGGVWKGSRKPLGEAEVVLTISLTVVFIKEF